MTTQTSNPPATTTKWTPRDLIAWSRAEWVLREQERRRCMKLVAEVRARWAGEPSAAVALAICDDLSAEIDGQE